MDERKNAAGRCEHNLVDHVNKINNDQKERMRQRSGICFSSCRSSQFKDKSIEWDAYQPLVFTTQTHCCIQGGLHGAGWVKSSFLPLTPLFFLGAEQSSISNSFMCKAALTSAAVYPGCQGRLTVWFLYLKPGEKLLLLLIQILWNHNVHVFVLILNLCVALRAKSVNSSRRHKSSPTGQISCFLFNILKQLDAALFKCYSNSSECAALMSFSGSRTIDVGIRLKINHSVMKVMFCWSLILFSSVAQGNKISGCVYTHTVLVCKINSSLVSDDLLTINSSSINNLLQSEDLVQQGAAGGSIPGWCFLILICLVTARWAQELNPAFLSWGN